MYTINFIAFHLLPLFSFVVPLGVLPKPKGLWGLPQNRQWVYATRDRGEKIVKIKLVVTCKVSCY